MCCDVCFLGLFGLHSWWVLVLIAVMIVLICDCFACWVCVAAVSCLISRLWCLAVVVVGFGDVGIRASWFLLYSV